MLSQRRRSPCDSVQVLPTIARPISGHLWRDKPQSNPLSSLGSRASWASQWLLDLLPCTSWFSVCKYPRVLKKNLIKWTLNISFSTPPPPASVSSPTVSFPGGMVGERHRAKPKSMWAGMLQMMCICVVPVLFLHIRCTSHGRMFWITFSSMELDSATLCSPGTGGLALLTRGLAETGASKPFGHPLFFRKAPCSKIRCPTHGPAVPTQSLCENSKHYHLQLWVHQAILLQKLGWIHRFLPHRTVVRHRLAVTLGSDASICIPINYLQK